MQRDFNLVSAGRQAESSSLSQRAKQNELANFWLGENLNDFDAAIRPSCRGISILGSSESHGSPVPASQHTRMCGAPGRSSLPPTAC